MAMNRNCAPLLQDSLAGGSKTVMFANVAPCERDAGESVCSLNFAARVRGVELGAVRKNVDAAADVRMLQAQVAAQQSQVRVLVCSCLPSWALLDAQLDVLECKICLCFACMLAASQSVTMRMEIQHAPIDQYPCHAKERQSCSLEEATLPERIHSACLHALKSYAASKIQSAA